MIIYYLVPNMYLKAIAATLLLCVTSISHALPDIKTWNTSAGLEVLYVQTSELPIVDIALTFDAGSARDGNMSGLSVMTHTLLDKGAGTLDSDGIASAFENVGAQFSTGASLDRSSLTLRSLSDEKLFNKALETFVTVLSRPTFPEKDFSREKNRLLISLEDQDQRPSQIVEKEFYRSLYQDHPYANSSYGSKESVSGLTLESVKKFYKNYLVSSNAVLAIVGDVTREQAEAIANDIGNSLPKGEKAAPLLATKKAQEKNQYVDFPSQQSHVRIGQLGIERGHPDYYSLYVGNHALGGGGFTSRLVEEVRSKRGLSYSVYSYFIPLQEPGPFVLGLQTRSDQVKEAIEVCYEVLNDYVENGPNEEELKLSKQNIMSGFPLRIDSNKDILGYLSVIGYYDLPLNYLQEFTSQIEKVTLQDIKKAFRKHIDTDSFVTVVVGSEQAS